MRTALLTSLCIAAGCALARFVDMRLHPEYSMPAFLPVAIAFIGAFIGAAAVSGLILLLKKWINKKESSQ